ncbi:MAG: CAP domain-containing protein [Acidobacteriota bacterium]
MKFSVLLLCGALFATTALSAGGPASLEQQLLEAVNQARWDNGQLAPLKGNAALDTASENHSQAMAQRNFFGHCDLDTGTDHGDRATAAGYPWSSVAENIAAGQDTIADLMSDWLASPGHRNNILSTSYREVGTGYFFQAGDLGNVRFDPDTDCVQEQIVGPFGGYWTQVFGRTSTGYPVVIDREAASTPDRNVDLYLYGNGWATQMRIRNENGSFTAWQAFSSNVAWPLSNGGGTKTVFVEIRNGAGTVRFANDSIELAGGAPIFSDGFESGNTSVWTTSFP